jgi:hypothetical protein
VAGANRTGLFAATPVATDDIATTNSKVGDPSIPAP